MQCCHCSGEDFEVPSVVTAALAASRHGVYPKNRVKDGWGVTVWSGCGPLHCACRGSNHERL